MPTLPSSLGPTEAEKLLRDEGRQVHNSKQQRQARAHTLGRRRTATVRALRALDKSSCGEAMGSLACKKDHRVLHSVGTITSA